MSIKSIIDILDRPENKSIHKIYSQKLKFCFITGKDMVRYKLTPDLDNRLVECYIKLAKLKSA